MKNLSGIYRGVVEDRNDPEEMNRCRIRIFGVHTPQKNKINNDKSGVATEELPWATPANPITEGSISGFGSWSVPLQGSHVFVFFENENPNQPVYFASVPGVPTQEPDTTMGFNDPDGDFPTSHRLDEPDVHRLARGVSEGTIVDGKNDNIDTDVEMSDGNTWSEPESFYNAQYPDNVVIATHGGNIIELDSTEGSKRIHIFHASNSYIEINDDGDMVIRNNKDRYEVIIGGRNIHIKENYNSTTDKNRTALVGENEHMKVKKNQTEIIGQNVERSIGENLTDTITDDATYNTGGNVVENTTGNHTDNVDGNQIENITGDHTETTQGNLTITVEGDCNITVTGECNLTANTVDINGAAGGGHLDGVVTGDCKCAFTGKPHIQKSSNVKGTL